MPPELIATWTLIFAYLLGSVSTAIIVCQLLGLPDPRTEGSHNPGATNVLRLGGKGPAILTLLGDMLKGVVPVLIAKYGLHLAPAWAAAAGFAAFLPFQLPMLFRWIAGQNYQVRADMHAFPVTEIVAVDDAPAAAVPTVPPELQVRHASLLFCQWP